MSQTCSHGYQASLSFHIILGVCDTISEGVFIAQFLLGAFAATVLVALLSLLPITGCQQQSAVHHLPCLL